MKERIFILLIFILGFFGANKIVLGQEINLEYDYKKDQEFKLVVRTQQLIEQDLGGFTQNIQNLIDSEILFKVVEVTGDSAKLEVAYKRLYFSMDGPMGEGMVMSSDGDKSDPINMIVRSMVNNPFYVILNKSGRILSVEGMEEVLGKINETLELIDDDIKESIQASIDNQFGEESFKSSFMTGLIVYPNYPLKIGETWSTTTMDYSTVPLEMNTTWTLGNVRRRIATIEGSATLQSKDTVNKNAKSTDAKSTKTKGSKNSNEKEVIVKKENNNIGMTGTNIINATINLSTGWLQESTQTSEISGIMVLPPDKYFSESVEIPLKIKTVTRTVIK